MRDGVSEKELHLVMFRHYFSIQCVWLGAKNEECQTGFWSVLLAKLGVELLFWLERGCAEICCCFVDTSGCVRFELVLIDFCVNVPDNVRKLKSGLF